MSGTFPNSLVPVASRIYTVAFPANGDQIVPVQVASKASADIIDYVFDVSALLAGTGDTLSSSVTMLSLDGQGGAYPVTAAWAETSDYLLGVMLCSGLPGTVVEISLLVTTSQGRTLTVPFVLAINDGSPAVSYTEPDFPTYTTVNGNVVMTTLSVLPLGYWTDGQVLMTDRKTLPEGYGLNGNVVMKLPEGLPGGTPTFESIAGDASNATVTAGDTTAALSDWLKKLAPAGAPFTAYLYADLPQNPDNWAVAIVTDKGIGSGPKGVVAMYNPISATWAGLSGETLV